MKKYRNLVTGEIEIVHAWDVSKKLKINHYKDMFQELYEE